MTDAAPAASPSAPPPPLAKSPSSTPSLDVAANATACVDAARPSVASEEERGDGGEFTPRGEADGKTPHR